MWQHDPNYTILSKIFHDIMFGDVLIFNFDRKQRNFEHFIANFVCPTKWIDFKKFIKC